ncbi:MAG: sugar phosphate isomerase/epimerase [Thermomicrobia bacterium]|nr:sugar phosphate isomerase/epimerase [Thermomicrobia bacterium]
MTNVPIALQLYTVREEAARDFVGTLDQVAAIGYAGVELAGYGPLTAAQLRAKLDALGMAVAGTHIALARMEAELATVIHECQTLGCPTLVCPFLPPERRTVDAYRTVAASLNRIGATAHAAGLDLCYHNHAFEFETTIDGLTAFDWLAAHTDPALVQLELDAFWAQKAGQHPTVLLDTYGGRVPLLHLKDMTADAEQTFAPVGTGSVDFAPIFAAAERGGVRWYIVEQDRAEGSAVAAARTSFANLKQMGKA